MINVAAGINESYSYRLDDFSSPWALMQYHLFGKGVLNIPHTLEVVSFQSVTPESKEKDWPDLQLHYMSIAGTSDFMRPFGLNEE
ncbi:hypothetical protein PoB_001833000, partial [Plakobranchus ocellatus]